MDYRAEVKKIEWEGIEGISFIAGGYEALVIPKIGSNLIMLKDLQRNLDLLRTPIHAEELKNNPVVYGIPILFPPNRINGGKFRINDRIYEFPINFPNINCHMHGFLYYQKWETVRTEVINKKSVEIEMKFFADKNTDFYQYFPHVFEVTLEYKLSKHGLEQKLTFLNLDSSPMPLGVGFHTALKIPFYEEGDAKNYKIKFSAGERWDTNEVNLPTGERRCLIGYEEEFKTKGVCPSEHDLRYHYRAEPIEIDGKKFHGAILEDEENRLSLVYEVGPKYKHWVIWNMGGCDEFLCPEPQSWMIDAPNIDLESDITGVRILEAKEKWQEISRLYVIKNSMEG